MPKIPKGKMLEPDKMRGLVPTRTNGVQDRVYKSYLDTLAPRTNPEIQLALASCPDVRFREFLDRIKVPHYQRISLSSIAKACDISLADFQNWWQRASTQAAIAHAQVESIEITKDMVRDARSKEGVCDRCDGMTWIAAPPGLPPETPGYKYSIDPITDDYVWRRDCPNCNGGKISRPGDSHSRDKILQMSGLIKVGAGVNVNVNQFGGASHASAIGDLEAMTIDVEP